MTLTGSCWFKRALRDLNYQISLDTYAWELHQAVDFMVERALLVVQGFLTLRIGGL